MPLISVVIGEGGSGGALAIASADRVYMLENSIYSVITPEGCASILWRNSANAQDAAEAMKVTAGDLKKLEVIDDVIPEPMGGAHRAPDETIDTVGRVIAEALDRTRQPRWRHPAQPPPGQVPGDGQEGALAPLVAVAAALRLSVLDQSPIRKGGTPADAVRETLELAELCDRLGYERYWLAEHHGSEALAGSTPEVLITRVAGLTRAHAASARAA